MKTLFYVILQKHGKLEIENTLLVHKHAGKLNSKGIIWLSLKFLFSQKSCVPLLFYGNRKRYLVLFCYLYINA